MCTARSGNFNPEGHTDFLDLYGTALDTEDEAVDPSFYTVTDTRLDGEHGTQAQLGRFHRFQLTFLATKKGDIALSPLTQAKKKKICPRILVRLFGNWRWCC